MPEPRYDSLTVIQGTDFEEVYQILDYTTGEWADWSEGTWEIAAEIRDHNEQLLARMANYGSPDGDIILADDGLLTLFLPAAFTATLPISRPYTNSTDVRIAGSRARGAYSFTLIATDTDTDDVSGLITGQFTVLQP